MTIEVVNVEFDAEQCSLRINGTNVKENPHIKLGQHHTIELELNRSFELQKENWDAAHLELLDDASDPTKKADIAALVMQEGLAHLCLIKSALTKTCAKIEYVVGKKKPNYSAKGNQLDKTTAKFFENMYNSVKRHVNFDTIKVILVGRCVFLRLILNSARSQLFFDSQSGHSE
jgi:protein pelota